MRSMPTSLAFLRRTVKAIQFKLLQAHLRSPFHVCLCSGNKNDSSELVRLKAMTKRVIEASSSEKSEQQNPDRSADREESLKRQALSFLSEYLPPPWMEKLLK